MEHELIDQLDEMGKIIGQVDKAIAHQEGLWHRSVHVWVINRKNEILLQHRSKEKTIYPNKWDCSFAGHVSAGENSKETVMREGKEEIDIDVNRRNLKFLFTLKEQIKFKKMKSNEFVDVYLLKQDYEIKKENMQQEEVDNLKYVSIEKFLKMIDSQNSSLVPHYEEYSLLRSHLLNYTENK